MSGNTKSQYPVFDNDSGPRRCEMSEYDLHIEAMNEKQEEIDRLREALRRGVALQTDPFV